MSKIGLTQREETWDSLEESPGSGESAQHRSHGGDSNAGAVVLSDSDNWETLDRYELLRELGRGGMGVVYCVHDRQLGRDVALKMLLSGVHANDKSRKRFMREARTVARLRHPNIVQVYDIGEHGNAVFFTMQVIDGPSLAERARTARLDAREAAAVVATVARALAYAHERGLVHRDVKPGNVLLDVSLDSKSSGATSSDGPDESLPVSDLTRPVLTDFGLVKNFDADQDTATLTRGGNVLGTPAYMAPEQLRGDVDAIGPHSDQYALGVTLWELASGQHPYADRSPPDIIHRVLFEEPPRLDDRSVPTALRRICHKAMARAPRERYRDCVALADDLDRFLAGEPVLAAAHAPLWYARRFVRRYRRMLALAGLVALTAVSVVWGLDALAAWRATRAENARQSAAEQRRIAMQTRVDALNANAADRQSAEQAERAFEGFANFADNAETRALARAWLDRGDLLERRTLRTTPSATPTPTDDLASARTAYATAYGLADTQTAQSAALLRLAALFRATYDWDALRQALVTLTRRSPDVAAHPDAQRLRRDVALLERRLADAAAIVDDASTGHARPEARLLARLARATRTPHNADVASLWDVDGDGVPELILAEKGQTDLTVVELDAATLPVRNHLALPDDSLPIKRLWPLARQKTGSPALVVTSSQRRSQVVRLADGRLERTTVLPRSDFRAVASGDLDGDGAVEHYGAYRYSIASIAGRGDGEYALESAFPANTHGSWSVRDLAVGDVDGDGRPELLAAVAGWIGYDVRAYRASERGLELAARDQLGKAVQIELVRAPGELRAAVLQVHDPSLPLNRRVFADDAPHGAARGIHLLALTANGWQPRTWIPWRPQPLKRRGRTMHMTTTWHLLFSGDLDGDGLDDLVASTHRTWLTVYRQRADGEFTELVVDGLVPLAIRDIDGDGAAELLVHTADAAAQVWVLGIGDDRVPPVEAVARDEIPDLIEPDIPPALRDDWRRARELVDMGLLAQAARRFEQIAALAAGTAAEAYALYQAGLVMEASRDRLTDESLVALSPLAGASALYRRAASAARAVRASAAASAQQLVTLQGRAWDGALGCDVRRMQNDAGLQAARARLALPDPSENTRREARRLAAMLAQTPVTFDFRKELDQRWRVHRPFDVRLDRRAEGLRVRTVDSAPLLSLPLRRTAASGRITLDASALAVDWAAGFTLALLPGHDLPVGLDTTQVVRGARGFVWRAGGGAGVYDEVVRCRTQEPYRAPVAEDPTLRERRLTWEFTGESMDGHQRERCRLELGPTILRRDRENPQRLDPLPEALTLVIAGVEVDGQVATTESLLRRLELVGFEVVSASPEPLTRAHHHLAVGRPDRALAVLDDQRDAMLDARGRPLVRAEVARAMALAGLRRERDGNQVLADALARAPDLDGLLVAIMRHQLDRFEPAVRTALGQDYYLQFFRAFRATRRYRDDARRMAPFMRHLDGLLRLPLGAFTEPGDALAHLKLLVTRGAAWRHNDQTVLGHRDLERAQELGEYLLAAWVHAGDRTFAGQAREQLTLAALHLAAIQAAWGEGDRAIATLLSALAAAPAPEAFADEIAIHDEFAVLHTHPRWPEIWRARKLGEWPGSATPRSVEPEFPQTQPQAVR